MLETVYECGKLTFSFNLSGFGICKGLLHCLAAVFLGSGVVLMRRIHTREGSEGEIGDGGVLGNTSRR